MDNSVKPSFDGNIEEIPEISVDNFTDNSKMAYFLSHVHSDHTAGLYGNYSSGKLRRNGGKIYMSEKSNHIVCGTHWYYNNLEEIVEPLKTDFTYTIELPDNKSFQVTLIPVRHMVGAVMFLFKTKDKIVLYTGDFVITNEEVRALRRLHDEEGNPMIIDAMYVDVTFGSPGYEHFPHPESTYDRVINKIEQWLTQSDKHRVALVPCYIFGYEDLYHAIYKKTNIKIFVINRERRNNLHSIYQALDGNDNFSTEDTEECKIHICQKKPWESHDVCGVSNPSDFKYLTFTMSAKPGCYYDPEMDNAPIEIDGQPDTLYLCYQTHCSKSQLDFFLDYFSPKRVKRFSTPIVADADGKYTPYKKEQNATCPNRDLVKKKLPF